MGISDVFPNGLDINDALGALEPVAILVLGMAVYAFSVFKFYRFVASRDMFALDLSKYEKSRFRWVRALLRVVSYTAKYIILFPIFAFLWFAVLTLILAFLSRGQSFENILQMALGTVTAIRVLAYYNEDLSRDVAKVLPFAVLAIFLINASFFTISESLDELKEANDHREAILYYLGFLIAAEFALRLIYGAAGFLLRVKSRPAPRSESESESAGSP